MRITSLTLREEKVGGERAPFELTRTLIDNVTRLDSSTTVLVVPLRFNTILPFPGLLGLPARLPCDRAASGQLTAARVYNVMTL